MLRKDSPKIGQLEQPKLLCKLGNCSNVQSSISAKPQNRLITIT